MLTLFPPNFRICSTRLFPCDPSSLSSPPFTVSCVFWAFDEAGLETCFFLPMLGLYDLDILFLHRLKYKLFLTQVKTFPVLEFVCEPDFSDFWPTSQSIRKKDKKILFSARKLIGENMTDQKKGNTKQTKTEWDRDTKNMGFFSYWWYQYLLSTALYMLEPWERNLFRILSFQPLKYILINKSYKK